MTQFASTLYPQTNPTSQALLDFREYVDRDSRDAADEARWWLAFGPPPWNFYSQSERSHIERVLTRLASLSG